MQIREILKRDAKFLKEKNLLDYSVLLGVEVVNDAGKKADDIVSEAVKKLDQKKENDRLTVIREQSDPLTSQKTVDEIRSTNLERAELRHQFTSKCGKYIYHIAVIDYLCDYNLDKKLENFVKTKKLSKENAQKISAVPPKDYAKRFVNFMNREVIINESNQKILIN